jgi:hypothetical protein
MRFVNLYFTGASPSGDYMVHRLGPKTERVNVAEFAWAPVCSLRVRPMLTTRNGKSNRPRKCALGPSTAYLDCSALASPLPLMRTSANWASAFSASRLNWRTVSLVYLWSIIFGKNCGGTVTMCAPASAAV